ncbi:DUF4270 family protein [uncultured Bacteroides sp.]|uniref:DUF4270 family protein n=1 Tax=uncultured Bacteroides sp. TaxID=162156 RepID=UPI002AA86A96|nr:DUF4270 family protein [uncultured Bacteroides sp.]
MNQKIWIFSSLFIFIITSCQDENSAAGSNLVESSLHNVQTDTCTVTLSTILADSVATSGDTICQVGHYSNSLWGDIQSSFYAEYNVPSASLNTELSYRFDSITITLLPTGNYVGDTLTTQHIYMHRLKEIVELDQYGYLYNTSSIPYEKEPFATLTFKNQPIRKKKQELRLPDEFGEELLNLMETDSRKLSSQDDFRNYLKGIAFIPDTNDACINGFGVSNSSLCITLYYSKLTETAVQMTATFTPSTTLNFNKVAQDRRNSSLAGLTPGADYSLSSIKTNNQAFIQGMTGMYIKLEFPHLNDLLEQGDIVTIENSMLYLYPVQGTYGETMPLPSALTMYTANENNVLQSSITNSYGTSVQDGSLVSDDSQRNGTYYSFDLTSYLQDNLGTFGSGRQNLMLMLPNSSYLTTLKGVILGDVDHPTSNLKLTVLYKIYNEQ